MVTAGALLSVPSGNVQGPQRPRQVVIVIPPSSGTAIASILASVKSTCPANRNVRADIPLDL